MPESREVAQVLVGEILVLLVMVAVVALLVVLLRRQPPAAAPSDPLVESRRLAAEQLVVDARDAARRLREEAEADSEAARRRADELFREQTAAARAEADATRSALQAELRSARQQVQALQAQAATAAEAAAREAAAATQLGRATLERVAGLSAAEAKAELVGELTRDAHREALASIRQIEAEALETAEAQAREIVGRAVQRVASGTTTESVVQVVALPSEEYKGRIIGREGRNIRTFEQVTGVNILIDDTPGAVTLSCFDPVRREIGRLTLEALVSDGRVHPQRIEEQHERSKAEVQALMQRAAEDALVEAGIHEIDPEITLLLGRLRYRTSYGQNVLAHLVETAHIASGLAHELHLPPRGIEVVKRGAFLHDLGKAVTHEVEGSHALVGAEIARRHGEDPDVVHAIEAHHQEVAPRTLEAWLTIASDSCSGGRPGARRESLEAYLARMERIEALAQAHEGVDRVFAMSAGRELRVMVLPEQVDDVGAQLIAREIARQIEDELTYPGQIRVTVVRESRATETAR